MSEPMKREKAIEIIDLNIRQRNHRMPPDVLAALKIALADMKEAQRRNNPEHP